MADKRIDMPSDVEFAKAITANLPQDYKHAKHMYEALGAAAVIAKAIKRAKKE